MFLGLIGSVIRLKIQEKALAKLFGDFLDDKTVEEKMDAEIQKHPKYPMLENDQKTGWYLQLVVDQRWLGIHDKKGNAVDGLESPEKITFYSVKIEAGQDKQKCKTLGFRAVPNGTEGLHWRYERCSYPFLINYVFKQKQAAEEFSKAFEECVQMKLSRKPAGPVTQEEDAARTECASELGGIPIPFD